MVDIALHKPLLVTTRYVCIRCGCVTVKTTVEMAVMKQPSYVVSFVFICFVCDAQTLALRYVSIFRFQVKRYPRRGRESFTCLVQCESERLARGVFRVRTVLEREWALKAMGRA